MGPGIFHVMSLLTLLSEQEYFGDEVDECTSADRLGLGKGRRPLSYFVLCYFCHGLDSSLKEFEDFVV